MAREAPEDEWAGLAPQDRLLHGDAPMLDLDDGADVSPETLRDAALAAEDAARGVAGVTNSEGGGASASRSIWSIATSHGFSGAYAATAHGLSASVLAGEGGAMQRDYAHHAARRRAHLDAPEAIGRRAGERAVARVNPGRLASGPMTVVYDPRVGASLIGHLIGAIGGQSITRKTSFLLDALGTRVFAEGIMIADDPHRPHGLQITAVRRRGAAGIADQHRRGRDAGDVAARFGRRRGNWGWSPPVTPRAGSAAHPAS